MGLRKGLSLVRGMRRSLTDDEQHKVAGAILEHLESHNWKIEAKNLTIASPALSASIFISEIVSRKKPPDCGAAAGNPSLA